MLFLLRREKKWNKLQVMGGVGVGVDVDVGGWDFRKNLAAEWRMYFSDRDGVLSSQLGHLVIPDVPLSRWLLLLPCTLLCAQPLLFDQCISFERSSSVSSSMCMDSPAIPDWATPERIAETLDRQYGGGELGGGPINPNKIFVDFFTCSLESIFDVRKKRWARSST